MSFTWEKGSATPPLTQTWPQQRLVSDLQDEELLLPAFLVILIKHGLYSQSENNCLSKKGMLATVLNPGRT